MQVIQGAGIDLAHTLESGQTFAFVPCGEGFVGVVEQKPLFVQQRGADLYLDCAAPHLPFWRRYFDLGRDYQAVLAPYAADARIAHLARSYPGLRVLKQPPWEALCAFILSANNNQKRIASIYLALSRALGEHLGAVGDVALYAFPSPEVLSRADEGLLRACGTGYRAPYLLGSARMVAQGFSLELEAMPYEAALQHLIQLPGVGEKVADCILLFAGGKDEALPIDVWMERVLREQYALSGSRKELKKQGQALFGAHAGIVQQLLFHAARRGDPGPASTGNHPL